MAPEMSGDEAPSIAETFEMLLSDVDARFAAIVEPEGASAANGTPRSTLEGRAVQESDLADVRELFAQLAAKHMRQVRDFMIDLKWGEAPTTWLALCEPAVRSLRGAAERLDLVELCAALDGFDNKLVLASTTDGNMIEGAPRDQLVATYEKLVAVMPTAFALDMDRTQRESVIVHSLLLQIPGVRKVTIERLYAAGLSSFDTIFAASPDDVAATTGIARDLADRIVESFQRYRGERKASVPDATRTHEREQIKKLAKQLRTQHDAFEQACSSWSDDAITQKKELRQARASTLLHVNVVLARLGEVDRLRAIERLPFGQKVDAIEAYLEEAERAYVATS